MGSRGRYVDWGSAPRPVVLAHRGASADAPENTTAAIALARDQGADGVELDLQLCATGEVVVFHDFTLRAFGLPRPLRELSLAAMRSFDLGGGARVPTLEDALSAAGPDLLLNLELKSHHLRGEGLEPAVARVLRRAAIPWARILLSSFNPVSLMRAAVLMPRAPKAWLFHAGQSRAWRTMWPRVLRPLPGFFALHPEHALCDEALVAHAHQAALRVHAWTADTTAARSRLLALGVDGLITNHPASLRQLLHAAGDSARAETACGE